MNGCCGVDGDVVGVAVVVVELLIGGVIGGVNVVVVVLMAVV